MTIDMARKLTLACYGIGVVLFVVRLFIPLPETVSEWLKYGFFAFVAVGFLICYSNCRCPHCNRVMRAGFRPIERCPFCNMKIGIDSRWGR